MSHTLPPKQCSANTPTWPDTISGSNLTTIKKIHVDNSTGSPANGLRDYVNSELTRRGLSSFSWTDQPIVVNVTTIKALHITELRTALDDCRSGYGTSLPCQTDSFGATGNWTSGATTGLPISSTHMNEMRTKMQYLMTACICESDQCQYCADCGYAYCSCECDNHQGCGCNWSSSARYIPASNGLSSATAHPYRVYGPAGGCGITEK